MRRALLALLIASALAACASAPAGPQRYAGNWEFQFETSGFVTDSGEGPYWLAAEGDNWPLLIAPFSDAGSPWGRAHIVVEGELSPEGQHGHLGAYKRELRVTRVIASTLVSAPR